SSELQATTPLSPLSLHDALPIYAVSGTREIGDPLLEFGDECADARDEGRVEALQDALLLAVRDVGNVQPDEVRVPDDVADRLDRSEEHTSELQSRENLVCRLLLE